MACVVRQHLEKGCVYVCVCVVNRPTIVALAANKAYMPRFSDPDTQIIASSSKLMSSDPTVEGSCGVVLFLA